MSKKFQIYIPFEKYEKELEHELKDFKKYESYYLSEKKLNCIWAQDILYDVQEISIDSIKDGSKKLKALNSHWVNLSVKNHRRSQLIQEQLNFYRSPELKFMGELPKQKFGTWILKSENLIWASVQNCHSIPGGAVHFKEDKDIPPSRAYLKLWELFTVYKIAPQKGQKVIDMGACPGGWSWVLTELGCDVTSVDKAELDALIQSKVQYISKDAFKLQPEEVGQFDWFFSDIICEPIRLFELVERWQRHSKNFVCTIKYKGTTDFETTYKFLSKSGSKIYHLYNNKHEVTWIWQR